MPAVNKAPGAEACVALVVAAGQRTAAVEIQEGHLAARSGATQGENIFDDSLAQQVRVPLVLVLDLHDALELRLQSPALRFHGLRAAPVRDVVDL